MSKGGATTSQAQDTSSFTDYAPWFNQLTQQQGQTLGQMNSQIPGLQQSIYNGGSAPTGVASSPSIVPIQAPQNVAGLGGGAMPITSMGGMNNGQST